MSAKYVLMVFQFKQRQKLIENALYLPLSPVSYLGLLLTRWGGPRKLDFPKSACVEGYAW